MSRPINSPMAHAHSAPGRRSCGPLSCTCRKKSPQSGFAMLLVFVMAAAIAIMLYMELPRVAFESQRNKEELLIERGEQYKRAIQLYFRKFKKYPGRIEDLENTNNIRFLRKRYIDPMTGKSEWRMIHIGPGGVFTDSLLNKNKDKDKDKKETSVNTFTGELGQIGATPPPSTPSGVAPQRPSDGRPRGGFPGQPGADGTITDPQQQQQPAVLFNQNAQMNGQPPPPPNAPTQPGGYPALSGIPQPGGFPAPGGYPAPGGNPTPGGYAPASSYQPPSGYMPQSSYQPPTSYPPPGSYAQPGTGAPAYPTNVPITSPGNPGFGQTPGGAGMTSNSATDMIRNLLTTPRTPPAGMGVATGGLQIGGGIAGVASTAEKIGIKIYNDREQYNEWEFVYDYSKDRTGAGMGAGALGNPAGNQQPTPSQQPGITGFNSGNTNTGFGSNPGGFGAAPGFGRQAQSGFNSAPAASSTGSSGSFGGFLPSIGSGPAQPPSGQQPGKPPQPGQQPPNPNGPTVGILPPPPPPPPPR